MPTIWVYLNASDHGYGYFLSGLDCTVSRLTEPSASIGLAKKQLLAHVEDCGTTPMLRRLALDRSGNQSVVSLGGFIDDAVDRHGRRGLAFFVAVTDFPAVDLEMVFSALQQWELGCGTILHKCVANIAVEPEDDAESLIDRVSDIIFTPLHAALQRCLNQQLASSFEVSLFQVPAVLVSEDAAEATFLFALLVSACSRQQQIRTVTLALDGVGDRNVYTIRINDSRDQMIDSETFLKRLIAASVLQPDSERSELASRDEARSRPHGLKTSKRQTWLASLWMAVKQESSGTERQRQHLLWAGVAATGVITLLGTILWLALR